MLLGRSTRSAAQTTGPSVGANGMAVDVRQAGACTTVVVSGRVTVDSSPHLRPVLHEAIGAAPPSGVVIDFTAASICGHLRDSLFVSVSGDESRMTTDFVLSGLVTDMELELGRGAATRDVP